MARWFFVFLLGTCRACFGTGLATPLKVDRVIFPIRPRWDKNTCSGASHDRCLTSRGSAARGCSAHADRRTFCWSAALLPLCGLTFELSGRRRQDARPGLAKMYRVPPDRAWWPAVGAPLERGVRHQCVGAVHGLFVGICIRRPTGSTHQGCPLERAPLDLRRLRPCTFEPDAWRSQTAQDSLRRSRPPRPKRR